MQQFLSIKVCIKASIPYSSLYLWPQVCGSFLLMYERKSISYSNLQVEPDHILAVPPGCRCCPPSLLVLQQLWLWRGQQWCGGTDPLCVGFPTRCPWHRWNGARWSPSPPWALPGLLCHLQFWITNDSTALSAFITVHGPYENALKQQLLRAVSTSTLRYLHTVAVRGFFVWFFLQTALQTFFYGPAHPGIKNIF